MPSLSSLIRYGVIAFLILIIVGLGGWYYLLRTSSAQISAESAARGFGEHVPSFDAGTNGSTARNIASRFTEATPAAAAPSAIKNSTGSTEQTGSDSRNVSSASVFWQVDATPVAGFSFSNARDSVRLYYVARATGHVFSANPDSHTVVRLTNTLFPKTGEAFLAGDGSAIMRHVNTLGSIETFSGSPTMSSSSESQLTGITLDLGIRAFAADPITKTIFYTEPDSAQGTVGITSLWNGTKAKRLFASSVGSWRLFALSDGRHVISESANDGVLGTAYEIQKDGAWKPLVRKLPGLTIRPRASSTALLYSSSSGGSVTLYGRLSSDTSAISLPVKTTADKCAWAPAQGIAYCAVPETAPSSHFLGNWYKGIEHTRDIWWKVDVRADSAEKVVVSDSTKHMHDVVDPVVDTSGNYLAYIDNTDHSLWAIKLPH